MLIPIRCFTCGKVLADKYLEYEKRKNEAEFTQKDVNPQILKDKIEQEYANNPNISKITERERAKKLEIEDKYFYGNVKTGKILDDLGLTRYCCRRHLITNVDMMEII